MRIESLVVPPLENNVFIVFEDGSDNAIIIDVAQGAIEIEKRLRELELKATLIVNTHGHADHTIENEKLRKLTGAKLAIHELDAYRLATDDEATRELRMERIPMEPDIQLIDGQEINYGGKSKLRVIHTPGHTEGSICLYEEKNGQLFSGDTLFSQGYGRVDGMGASREAIIGSLKKLMRLPTQTEVYPGHGRFTTIGEEEWLKEMIGTSESQEEI